MALPENRVPVTFGGIDDYFYSLTEVRIDGNIGLCRSGGSGRRARFRVWWAQACRSSSLLFGTNKQNLHEVPVTHFRCVFFSVGPTLILLASAVWRIFLSKEFQKLSTDSRKSFSLKTSSVTTPLKCLLSMSTTGSSLELLTTARLW